MILRSLLLAIVALTMALLQSVLLSQAQTQPLATDQAWPQRPVKFIVPLGAGSGVDITARLLTSKLSARWGKPVVIENRPGGDGIVALSAFTSARDNHTLLFSPSSAFAAHPFLYEKLPYDPSDLVPIARVTSTLVGISVTSSLNVKTLPELVAMARAEPGKLNWAGITGSMDLVFAGFLHSAGVNINKIPYRDGVQALNDLAEGRIQVYLNALAVARPQLEAGKVRMIAVANQERAPSMPNLQTAIEAGYPEATFDGLVGVFGLRDITTEVNSRVGADVLAVLADPAVVAQLETASQLVRPGDAKEFAAALEKQRSVIGTAAANLGVKPR